MLKNQANVVTAARLYDGMRANPGNIIILEGLDKAGKSTQVAALESVAWSSPPPLFTHMPSGLTSVTSDIYDLTETADIDSPLARQLLHLACHAENVEAIRAASRKQAVFIDRWWWSTVAYGWYGAHLEDSVPAEVFFGMIEAVWGSIRPSLVCLFLKPFQHDELNVSGVTQGYRQLSEQHPDLVFQVPVDRAEHMTQAIMNELIARRIVDAA